MQSISHHFWAPDVVVVNGQRLLYISLYNSAEDSKIGVLKEVSPGHFQFHGIITSSKDTGIDDTIDPEVIADSKTGEVWLFFGSVGGIHRIQLANDGLSVKKNAEYIHVAGLSVRENPSRSNVFEGCYLHKRNGYWYMFVSSGFYGDHTYKLLVGRSKKLTGVFRSRDGKPMTKGHATPVIQSAKDDFFYGPGHCGEIFSKNGCDYIFYHCHNRDVSPNHRPMMLQEIKWDKEGWPYVEDGKPQ
jgi:arabinan endo-1,5-alpha-L-arabinosidase